MEDHQLSEMSVEDTKALIKTDPVKYFKLFLEEQGSSFNGFNYGDFSPINGFRADEVYSEGGYEGGGEHAEIVAAISYEGESENLAYVRFTGFYCSYNGTEWDESSLERVYPREVVVTQYFTDEA